MRRGQTTLHEFLFGTFGAENIRTVGDEAFAHKGSLADGADETVVVPVTVFEGDETSSANTGNWLSTSCTSLGEKFTKAIGTIWFVFL